MLDAEKKIERAIKSLIVKKFQLEIDPEKIEDCTPIFGSGLGLDSVDSIELVVSLEQAFGIFFEDEELNMELYPTVKCLADFVRSKLPSGIQETGRFQ